MIKKTLTINNQIKLKKKNTVKSILYTFNKIREKQTLSDSEKINQWLAILIFAVYQHYYR